MPVTGLTASDNIGVTGYLITESATAPAARAAGWTATAPTSFTFSAAGSQNRLRLGQRCRRQRLRQPLRQSSPSPCLTPPHRQSAAFSLPATATIPDRSGLRPHRQRQHRRQRLPDHRKRHRPCSQSSRLDRHRPDQLHLQRRRQPKPPTPGPKTPPATSPPTAPAVVTITLPDTTAPTVATFSLPATATSPDRRQSAGFTATDNIGVSGYLITESATAPAAGAAGWTATAPTSFTFSAAGSQNRLRLGQRRRRQRIRQSLQPSSPSPCRIPPHRQWPAFTMPATATTLTVAISSFTATDNVGVSGYLVTESATVPAAGAAGWTATAPTSYTFSAAGSQDRLRLGQRRRRQRLRQSLQRRDHHPA